MSATDDFASRRPHAIPSIIALGALLGGIGDCPYVYYQILRWVVCAAAIFVAWQAWSFKEFWAIWLFGIVGVIFNPAFSFHMERDAWRILDLLAALAFFIGIIFVSRPTAPKDPSVGDNSVSDKKEVES